MISEREVIELLVQASGIPEGEFLELWKIVREDDAWMNRLMKADWEKRPRKTVPDIIEYYETSRAWFANEWNHGRTSLLALATDSNQSLSPGAWFGPFVERIPTGGSVLDYGGGLWNDTACLAFAGYTVTQAEIKGPVTRFLKTFRERVEKRDRLRILEVDSEFPVTESYDGITCFEVLEHLLRPREFASHLYEHLRPGGTFAISVSFSEPEHAPYHMHASLSIPGAWEDVMNGIGFRFKYACPDSTRRIWVKP